MSRLTALDRMILLFPEVVHRVVQGRNPRLVDAAARRARYRQAVGRLFDTAKTAALMDALTKGGHTKVRRSLPGVRDSLSQQALVALLNESQDWDRTIDAIAAGHVPFGLHPTGLETDPADYARLRTQANDEGNPMQTFAHALLAADALAIDLLGVIEDEDTASGIKQSDDAMITDALARARSILRDTGVPQNLVNSVEEMHKMRALGDLKLSVGGPSLKGAEEKAMYQKGKDFMNGDTPAAPAPTPAAPVSGANGLGIVLNPAFMPMVNAALTGATDGKVTDFSVIMKMADDAVGRVKIAEAEVNRFKGLLANSESKLAMAGSAAALTAQPASKGGVAIPHGEIIWLNANDLDWGGKHKLLNLQVPTFKWDAPHPYVPESDPNYKFRPGLLTKFLVALVRGHKSWLSGMPGTGKSTFVKEVCARLGWPMIRVNFDSEITRMDLVGREVLRQDGGVTVSEFVEGILPWALQLPCVLLCDEVDFIRPDVAYVFQRVLEDEGLLLTEDGGRLVMPNPMFRLAATANTKGSGDEFGMFAGVRTQSAAFRDRFQAWVEFEYLKAKEEGELLLKRYPDLPPAVAESFVKFAGEVRTGFTNGEVFETISPRTLFSMASYFLQLNPIVGEAAARTFAMETAVFGRCTKTDEAKIKEYAARVFK